MDKSPTLIGRAELISFPALSVSSVPARIDTGAKTSSIWASNIVERDNQLYFVLFNVQSPLYTAEIIKSVDFQMRTVASSNGLAERRYAVKLKVTIVGRTINAYFTLANRSAQAYPVLIGRNVLRGKFLVDVKQGQTALAAEQARTAALRSQSNHKEAL